MKCPNSACNREVDDDWKICPFCGTAVPQKKTCSGCGKELQPEWKVCPYCQTPVQGNGAAGTTLREFCGGCGTEIPPGTGQSFKCEECGGIFCLNCRVDHPDGKLLPICEGCGGPLVEKIKEEKVAEQRRSEEARKRAEEEKQKREEERRRKTEEEKRYKEEERRKEEAQRRFKKDSQGIITDSLTGLEWYVGPDKDTNWDGAKTWVEGLTVDGGGWRMPAGEELKGLYQEGVGKWNLDPAFKTTGWWVWSGETKDTFSWAWVFAFPGSGNENWTMRNNFQDARAFAVRSRR